MGSTISELLKTMNTSKKLIIFSTSSSLLLCFQRPCRSPKISTICFKRGQLISRITCWRWRLLVSLLALQDNYSSALPQQQQQRQQLLLQLLLLLRGNESKDSRLNIDFLNVFFKRKNTINSC